MVHVSTAGNIQLHVLGGQSSGHANEILERWGRPFLQHTFLYHLSRLDHRHNFSPYFYPIYLTLFPPAERTTPSAFLTASRHPLASFVPQFGLVLAAGFLLTPRTGLVFAMFVQTVAFVVFNKVCTSQVSSSCPNLRPPQS